MIKIAEKEITFVVQGAVKKEQIVSCFESIRQHFKKSQIILSTWKGFNLDFDKKLYDKLVLNDDPGTFETFMPNPKTKKLEKRKDNNINRQILSTINGLNKVNTKYVFKIRTDFLITGNDFLGYFEKFNKYENKYKIFKKRVLACTFITRNPKMNVPYPFHISDFAFFGLTEDLINLFNIPLVSKEEQNWFYKHELPQMFKYVKDGKFKKKNIKKNIAGRYAPEQVLFLSLLRKNGIDPKCNYYYDISLENINLTEHYIANNFVLLNFKQFNLLPLKTELMINKWSSRYIGACYTHYDFLKLYKEFCDSGVKLPKNDIERKVPIFLLIKRKILKFFCNIACFFIDDKKLKNKIRRIYK